MPKEFCEGQTLTIVKIFTEVDTSEATSTITVKNDDGDHIIFLPMQSYVQSEEFSRKAVLTFVKPASDLHNHPFERPEDEYCDDCGCKHWDCGCPLWYCDVLREGQTLTVVELPVKDQQDLYNSGHLSYHTGDDHFVPIFVKLNRFRCHRLAADDDGFITYFGVLETINQEKEK